MWWVWWQGGREQGKKHNRQGERKEEWEIASEGKDRGKQGWMALVRKDRSQQRGEEEHEIDRDKEIERGGRGGMQGREREGDRVDGREEKGKKCEGQEGKGGGKVGDCQGETGTGEHDRREEEEREREYQRQGRRCRRERTGAVGHVWRGEEEGEGKDQRQGRRRCRRKRTGAGGHVRREERSRQGRRRRCRRERDRK